MYNTTTKHKKGTKMVIIPMILLKENNLSPISKGEAGWIDIYRRKYPGISDEELRLIKADDDKFRKNIKKKTTAIKIAKKGGKIKYCWQCREKKPSENFYIHSRRPCFSCFKKWNDEKLSKEGNKEKISKSKVVERILHKGFTKINDDSSNDSTGGQKSKLVKFKKRPRCVK